MGGRGLGAVLKRSGRTDAAQLPPPAVHVDTGRIHPCRDLRRSVQGPCARSSRVVFMAIGREGHGSGLLAGSGTSATITATIVAALRRPKGSLAWSPSAESAPICRRPPRAGGGLGLKAARFRQRRTGRRACPRRGQGAAIPAAWLTLAASGRLPGATHSERAFRVCEDGTLGVARGLEGGGGHGSKHEVREADTTERPGPCEVQRASPGPTLPPKAGSRALRREFVERPVCPASLGGWGDWQSGGVVPATQAVNVSSDCRLRQVLDAFTVQGGDT